MTLAFVAFFLSLGGLGNHLPMSLATALYEVGNSWLIILLYMAMLFGVLDLGLATHLIPRHFLRESVIGSLSVFVFLTALFTYAYAHFNHKVRVEMTLNTQGKVKKDVKLVLISDIHLGYHNRRSDLHRWLQQIMREKPDAILIAGDLVDGSIRPVNEEHSAEEFKQLPVPVYAILGNHDYYTGTQADLAFCRQAGIKVLRDSIAYFGDIAIVGRDDRTNPYRKSLKDIMQNVDRSKYIIEMDHQPYHLEEAEQNGVDFEFAGHTHYGQVWPISWITRAVYEDAVGPYRKGNTRYYVSSGLGIWGAKFRIGTQSEYVVAQLK
jgi:predicted MPP superfamily phosphohydrolase